MSWQDFREIRIEPNAILAFFGFIQPPVDVSGIVRALGIELCFVNSVGDNRSGRAITQAGKARIEIVQDQPSVRQRFTIGHELGHLIMHPVPPDGIFRENYSVGDWREIEANAFAADLLVPLDMLESTAPAVGYSIPALASMFEVSEGTMGIRITKLRHRLLRGGR